MMDELNVNQVEFGALAGASKSMVNQWRSGLIDSIAPQYAFALEEKTGYVARWIMLGLGPERIDKTTVSVIRLMENMTPQQREQLFKIGTQL